MSVHTLTYEQFEEVIDSNPIVFIAFGADWCQPCQVFASFYEEVADLYPAVYFSSIDIETESAFVETFHVASIPYLLVLKDAVVIYAHAGVMPKSTLIELVEQALEVEVPKPPQRDASSQSVETQE